MFESRAAEVTIAYWLAPVLCVGGGLLLACPDESPRTPKGDACGIRPAARAGACVGSAEKRFADVSARGAGHGLLEPIWEVLAPDGALATFFKLLVALGCLPGLLVFLPVSGILAALGCLLGYGACLWRRLAPKVLAPDSALATFFKAPPAAGRAKGEPPAPEEITWSRWTTLKAYASYALMFLMGVTRECVVRCRALAGNKLAREYVDRERWDTGWVEFYKQHMYRWIFEAFNRPICSAPDAAFETVQRTRPCGSYYGSLLAPLQDFVCTDKSSTCINLGSYNYLGFGGIDEYCLPTAKAAALEQGFSAGGTRTEGGTLPIHLELEREVAKYLQKEDAIVMGMGFATNSTILPALFEAQAGGSGILVLSDERNHKSIVEGIRLSGAAVRAFKHNSMTDLEAALQRGVTEVQPSGRPWRKIFVVVEGIYSMEGDFCRLREIVTLKNKYKAYLYLDEAHSIGGVGPTGRGVTELLGVPTGEVDVMMGTFTKSFGSSGGYVASSKAVIDTLRKNAPGSCLASAMAPPAAVQALAAFQVISGAKGGSVGAKKLAAVRDNSNYFRERLIDLGYKVLGDVDSTVVPVMIGYSRGMSFFSRMCSERGIATVVVGYPAVPVMHERARFCISAAHTREQLDHVISSLHDIGKKLGLLYDKTPDQQVLEARRARRAEYASWLRSAPLVPAAMVQVAPAAETWTPEPLVPVLHSESALLEAALQASTTVEVRSALDFRLFDPLGFIGRPSLKAKEAMKATLDVYGFGACGPRGFYGTTMPHLQLEDKIAEFLRVPAAIAYSAGVATISSVLPAHIKSTDHVVTDTEVNLGIRTGLRLCKSKVSYAQQGDLAAMERLLSEAVKVEDPRKALGRRVFIVAEAISQRTGRVCPLRELVALKEKFGAVLILDESLSFGTLGEHGRGLCELQGVDIARVDAVVGSLEHAIAGVGGFCAGRKSLITHQRLSGAGYVFSAAKPPAACSASVAMIDDLLSKDGAARLTKLKSNIALLHEELRRVAAQDKELVQLVSGAESFVQYLRWTGETDAEEWLQAVAEQCKRSGGLAVQVCSPGLIGAEASFGARIGAPGAPPPSLRFCVSERHSAGDIAAAAAALREALAAVAR